MEIVENDSQITSSGASFEAKSAKKERGVKESGAKKESFIKAALFAFLLGLIGVALWVVIGAYANFISAWVAFLIAFGIAYGYKLGNGPKKWKIPTLIIIYVVQIFVAVYLMYFLIIKQILPGIGFFEVFSVLSIPEIAAEMSGEYIYIAIFSVLGLACLFIEQVAASRQQKINSGEVAAKPGARFSKVVNFTGDFDAMSEKIKQELGDNGYALQKYGDEAIYRNGDGVWVASKFFKYEKVEGGIKIDAFVIISGKEYGLDGFVGSVAKKPLKKFTDDIVEMIEKG